MRPIFASPQHFSFPAELRTAAAAYLERSHDHRYGNARTWLKGAFLLAGVIALYGASLRATHALAFFVSYVGMYCVAVMLAVNVVHDASHYALFRSRRLNALAMRVAGLPLGMEPVYWQARHVRYHHPWANIEHHDLDTAATVFLRQTPFQKWYPQFRFQHLYWPVVAGLSLIYIDWVHDGSDRLGVTPLARERLLSGPRGWAVFLGTKLLHFGVFLLAPLLMSGPASGYGTVIAAYLCGLIVASCVLVMLLLGTHWADAQFFELPGDGRLPHTREEHAFLTCCDWTIRPAFAHGWLGGLNHHLTHHLFPAWGHRHYPALADIVAQLATRHSLPYRRLNYRQLHAAQQRFLKNLGQRPAIVQP